MTRIIRGTEDWLHVYANPYFKIEMWHLPGTFLSRSFAAFRMTLAVGWDVL